MFIKAVVSYECNGPEKIQDADIPKPSCRQAFLQGMDFGLNYFDLQALDGHAAEESPIPFLSGGDITDMIVETGADVSAFKAGDHGIINPSLSCGKCENCRASGESVREHLRLVFER